MIEEKNKVLRKRGNKGLDIGGFYDLGYEHSIFQKSLRGVLQESMSYISN